MTLYQDQALVTVQVVGCRADGDWLVFALGPGSGDTFNLRATSVHAYRRFGGNVLHVFTTGGAFALASPSGPQTLNSAISCLRARTDP
jgi:hypothetical protein